VVLTSRDFLEDAQSPRYCLKCWYDLRGQLEFRCPECGREFDPAKARTFSSLPRRQYLNRQMLRVLLLLGIVALVEFFCVVLTYETVGEVAASALFMCVFVPGNLLVLVSSVLRRPRLTIALGIIVALLIIPLQVWFGARLVMLNIEVKRMVRYVEDGQLQNGAYPADLSQYAFLFESNRDHIQEYKPNSMHGYNIRWYISTPTTSHWYNPVEGWCYYPD
jgi:hypothetical protein